MNNILSLYQSNRNAFDDRTLSQVLHFTGDGKLRDKSSTSLDFREFLAEIPSQLIARFADDCLAESFPDSGLALQDIINQIGSRLSFSVEDGLYRGNRNSIGFDGIWTTTDEYSIVVEVKTTDAYRIDLDVIASYRDQLAVEGRIDKSKSSILIIVGRENTGDLESQIRGSRHAWDIRLLSTDALISLLTLKETLNDAKTIQQITELLKPREYTRVDRLIELIFVTSKDLQLESPEEEAEEITSGKIGRKSSDKKEPPVNFHEECLTKVRNVLKMNLVKQTKIGYSNTDRSTALICAVSKYYKQGQAEKFWFALHPHQQEFLDGYKHGYISFGCGTSKNTLLIPYDEFEPFIKNCGKTENIERMYWHIIILRQGDEFFIAQPKLSRNVKINISKYKI